MCLSPRVLPKTTRLKVKLVNSAHSIPFGAFNGPLKVFIDGISRSVCPLMFYVFSIFEKSLVYISSAINEIFILIYKTSNKIFFLKTFYKNQTKIVCEKNHNCCLGKDHSPLPAHCREASKTSSCLSYTGQGDSKVSRYKSLRPGLDWPFSLLRNRVPD